MDLMPNGLVTLQSNQNVHDRKDDLILELQEKARLVAEEHDMWKAVTAKQGNMSVAPAPQVLVSANQ